MCNIKPIALVTLLSLSNASVGASTREVRHLQGGAFSDDPPNGWCTSDFQCRNDEYCADGVCREFGTCGQFIDCLNPSNIYDAASCVGILSCSTNEICGVDCGNSFCPPNEEEFDCGIDPCDVDICNEYHVSCASYNCGGCNSIFFDAAGNQVCNGSNNDRGSCVLNPGCNALGLRGECCPSSNGEYLSCCDEEVDSDDPPQNGSCLLNPQCRALGLQGDCCPSSNGEFLSCCDERVSDDPPPIGSCLLNPGCRALGLQGECCPSLNGDFLSCCDEDSDDPPPNGSCTSDFDCQANREYCAGGVCREFGTCGDFNDCLNPSNTYVTPDCVGVLLCSGHGVCGVECGNSFCPPNEEEFDCGVDPCDVDVCNEPHVSCASYNCDGCNSVFFDSAGNEVCNDASNQPTCVLNPRCRALGLQGDCCPTSNGEFLECCDEGGNSDDPPLPNGSCQLNPSCRALGLQGECCPSANGVFLSCCDDSDDTPPNGSCTSDFDCRNTEYCAEGVCREFGSCGQFIDCLNPSNVYETPSCVGILSCAGNLCGVDCGNSFCHPNEEEFDCGIDPCDVDTCNEPHVSCASYNCDGCFSFFFDAAGNEVCSDPGNDHGSRACSANPMCAADGLGGLCCPTNDGTFLDCCNVSPSLFSADPPALTSDDPLHRSCALNPVCVSEGLSGVCCPTLEGDFLDCCDH